MLNSIIANSNRSNSAVARLAAFSGSAGEPFERFGKNPAEGYHIETVMYRASELCDVMAHECALFGNFL